MAIQKKQFNYCEGVYPILKDRRQLNQCIGFYNDIDLKFGFGMVDNRQIIIPAESTVLLRNGESYKISEDLKSIWEDPYHHVVTIIRGEKQERLSIPLIFISDYSRPRESSSEKVYVLTCPLPDKEVVDLRPQNQHYLQMLHELLEQLPKRNWNHRYGGAVTMRDLNVFKINKPIREAIVLSQGLGNIHEDEYVALLRLLVNNIEKFYRRFLGGPFNDDHWNILPFNPHVGEGCDKEGLMQLLSFVRSDGTRSELEEQATQEFGRIDEWQHEDNWIDRWNRRES